MSSPEQFIPPALNVPNSSPDSGGPNQVSNVANIPGSQEQQGNWSRSVSRSHQIKQATTTVIQNRSQLVTYLKQNGLDLLTSSIEFQESGDFILSSYVIYPSHNNQKEPLSQFIQRYDFLKEPVEKIRNSLRPVQGQMNILTRRKY
jgi:hypothetical protein